MTPLLPNLSGRCGDPRGGKPPCLLRNAPELPRRLTGLEEFAEPEQTGPVAALVAVGITAWIFMRNGRQESTPAGFGCGSFLLL